MPEAELEDVMLGFMEGRFDVLCATSIVENGLDVPTREHYHHQPRRPPRPQRALPTSRPRRVVPTGAPTRTC